MLPMEFIEVVARVLFTLISNEPCPPNAEVLFETSNFQLESQIGRKC